MWGKNPEPKPTNTPAAKTPEPIASVPPKPPDAAAVTTPAPVAVTPAPAASPAYPSPAPQLSANASRIGPGLKVHGVISGESDLIVEGETNGKIYLSNARVTVAKTGRVQADIEGLEISIEGSVQGNLKATDRIRLGASSNVQGSLITPRFAIEDGARLRGKVEMSRPGDPKPVEKSVEKPATKVVESKAIESKPVDTKNASPISTATPASADAGNIRAAAARTQGD
ncbi:MAG: polymer-forming cytoskeletal protein [Candidatus Acidiferrales bacterium]